MNSWSVYLVASVLLLVFTYVLVGRKINLTLRLFLFISVAVVLFVPAAVPDTQALAPAWFVIGFEAVFGDPQAAFKAFKPLGMGLFLAYLALFLRLFFRRNA